ncbi:transcription initiation factor TFIID subunit 3-like isoform X2 [Anastrepha ludens]|uniref:transcription initiation factor TFIID subunit 3-like isoform X2 n=1 Tax=Anastrepha ludens TaxID=28586 RepID=UPI0023AF1993|nr:transcription initiation factor TFIID subunit 3-like isoform X2 [Anastrepha ludens]
MADQYMRELLRIAVAQICQTIGYHVIQATPLELLQDTLHKFLHEFSRELRRQVEHYNRTEANFSDIYLALNNLNINVHELLDYVNCVQPVSLAVEIPKFPAHKNTNLNFLKPGSTEVLTRPVHIYEYLPPMLPSDSGSLLSAHYMQSYSSFSYRHDKYWENAGTITDINQKVYTKPDQYLTGCGYTVATASGSIKRLGELKESVPSEPSPICLKTTISSCHSYDEEGRPTREISSVVMTTGGFISPAIEGKLPDTIVPKFIEKLLGLDAPPPPPPSPPPAPVADENLIIEHKPRNNSTSASIDLSSIGVSFSAQPTKVPINAGKPPIPGVSNSNTFLTKYPLVNKNVAASEVVNPTAPKKAVPNHLTQHTLQAPTLASKLLKKAKKKNTQNLSNPLAAKFNRPDLQASEPGLISAGMHSSEKTQRRNKKILQKMLKTGMDSAPDYCDAIFQRLKMEKFLKKQSKYQKKLLNRHKNNVQSNKPEGLAKLDEKKLCLPLLSTTKSNSATPSMKECLPPPLVTNSTAQTCVSKPELALISSVALPKTLMKDNRFDAVSNLIHDGVLDNVQIPVNVSLGHDKKAFPGMKLSAELDKNKLNIFKKISKQKPQKPLSPNTNCMASAQIYGGNEGQFINLPCGTTITPSPTLLNRLTSGDTNSVSPEGLEKSPNMPINCDHGSAIDLASNINSSSFSEVMMPCVLNNSPPQLDEVNKPKKRGRKPGSKNSLRQAVVSPNNPSQMAQLKKIKRLKSAKHAYPFPLGNLETANFMSNRMELCTRKEDNILNLPHVEGIVPRNLSTNVKEYRKERKKNKVKNQPLNMSTSEKNILKEEAGVPTKEEVNTINKKLMRMDTVLQPLEAFNETLMETDKEVGKVIPAKLAPTYKSPTSKKRSAHQMPPANQTNSSLISGLHPNMFMPTSGIGRVPSLLKLCPFPTGPGLIPTTAQNLLFPRLPAAFHLPIPSFKHHCVDKVTNAESESTRKSLDLLLSQPSGERSYCNVPPFVPESMKLMSHESKASITKLERDSPNIFKPQQPSAIGDRILKNFDNWSTPDMHSSLNPGEGQKSNERNSIKSPKPKTENSSLVGDIYFQNASPNKTLAASSASVRILNNDDPIELSDDSVEYPLRSVFNTSSELLSKKLNQNQHQLTTPPLNFPHVEDLFLPVCNDTAKDSTSDLNFNSQDPKKSKKATKYSKSTKDIYPNPTADLSSIELFNAEKGGVGKLAGGADLIPLISTGSAYSSKTIPSTSLTATVATPFALLKKDFPPPKTFENSLSANIDGNGILCTNTELHKKKKEHKRLKKLKDDKVKKKKDKKSKNKERVECPEKFLLKNDTVYKDKLKEALLGGEEQRLMNKDLLKKLKKEKKKKYKQLLTDAVEQAAITPVIDASDICRVEKPNTIFSIGSTLPNLTPTTSVASSATSFVPKLTLKLGSVPSPSQFNDTVQRNLSSATTVASKELGKKREPSPELARISPLVTRPPKQKFNISETVTTSLLNSNQLDSIPPSGSNPNNTLDPLTEINVSTVISPINPTIRSIVPPPSPWSSGGTISASSVLLPQQLLQSATAQEHLGFSSKADGGLLANTIAGTTRSLSSTESQNPVPLISETSRPSSYIDAEGNRVWICPACGKVDDGSPMIGCDGCDAWYHWICVGISIAPKDNEDWFCRVCITRKKGIHATDKKRKRNKKK